MNTATKLKASFDLSAFDKLSHGAFGTNHTNAASKPDNQLNVVLAIHLSQIIEDENQPRKDFHDEHWQDFVGDIKRRGVQTPIHVRPAVDGIYTIIHGARRYRASIEAGLSTIAAIIESNTVVFDDYSQVLENTKRANMAAMDIALFIKKRIAAGDSKGKVAEQLSESASYISFHLALTEMPVLVETAYKAGKVKGAQLVYQLNKLYDESPLLTESIINHHDEITNALIIQARKSLEVPRIPATQTVWTGLEVTEASDSDMLVMLQATQDGFIQEQTTQNRSIDEATMHGNNADNDTAEVSVRVTELPCQNTDNKENSAATLANPGKIKKPLLLAYYQDNQPCVVMLKERPTGAGFVWIKLEASGETIEVLADQVKLSMLTEAQGRE